MPNVSLSGIEFEIKGSADSASDSINRLTNNLNELNKALQNVNGIKVLASGAKKLSDAMAGLSKVNVSGVASSLKAIGETIRSLQGIENVAKSLGSFGSGMGRLAKESEKLPDVAIWLSKISQIDFSNLNGFSETAKNVGNFARGMAKLSENPDGLATIEEWLRKISEIDFSNLERATEAISNLAIATKNIKNIKANNTVIGEPDKLAGIAMKLSSAFKSIGSAALGAGKVVAKGFGSLISYPIKTATSKVTGLGKSIKGVIGGFKRIVGYRIIRSIIKEITQGFQEGVKNLYEWSRLTGGGMGSQNKTFAQSLDQIATSMMYFKNSVGAAVSPIINALAPAIDFLVDKIVTLLNVINQLFAKLTGAASWTRAKKNATEYGDAVGGAGDAAKEALKYLAPFDELNVLPDDKDKGGGGGGGTDYSDMFEDVTEFNQAIADFADAIKEKVSAGDWQGLGELLGNKVNEVVEMIPWGTLGTKVGTGINAWFTTKYWTLETINFQNIGAKIAEFLNNALEEINFNTIGRTITQKFTILGDFIIGAIENIDWLLVGQSIGDFLRGAFDQVSEWLQSIDWAEFGDTLYNALKDAIEGIDFDSLADSVFTFLGTALGAAVSLIGSFVSDVVEDIKNYFLQYITDENDDGNFGGGEIIAGILQGMGRAILGIGTWIYDHIWTPIKNGFKNAFGLGSGSDDTASDVYDTGVGVGNQFLSGLASLFKSPINWVKEHIVDKIKDALADNSLWEGGTTIDESGFSGTSGKIPIGIEVTGVTDSIPDVDKVSKDWGIEVVSGEDKILPSKKSSTSWTAQMTTAEDNVPSNQKSIPSIANFLSIHNGLTDAQKTIDTTSNYTSTKSSLTETQRTISTWSKYSAIKNNLTEAQKTISTYAKYNAIKNNLDANKRTISTYAAYNAVKNNLNATKRTISTWAQYNAVKNNLSSDQRTINSYANFTSFYKNFKSGTVNNNGSTPDINSRAHFTDDTIDYTPEIEVKARIKSHNTDIEDWYASGGVITPHGRVPITQFASGGGFWSGMGQLFLARERGPELVGTLKGHTAVMNNDQIVASVSSGVARAIAGIQFHMQGLPTMVTSSESNGMDEDSIYRAMLRALNDSDVFPEEIDLDGAVVYRKMVQRNKMERSRTGINPMMAS